MSYQHEIYVAIRTDGQTGSGTWSDPYDGSTATKFDTVMANRTSGECVRLLPGTFPTLGHSGSSGSTGGFAAPNGVRVVGSGLGVTTVQLTGVSSGTRYVFGTDFGATSLDGGFELSDLTLDCALASAGTGSTVGAIRLRGKHVFLRRVKVINYGSKTSGQEIRVITAAGENSENCVIEECVVEAHPDAHVGKAIMFAFEGSTNGHRFCAIRNCAGRGQETFEQPPDISDKDFAAIAPGVGLGTIIEGNQFANVYYGIYGSQQAAKDIVIWNNYFRNVFKGILWDEASAAAVGRIVAQENIIELSRQLSFPIGAEFTASAANRFVDLVARRNIVRQVVDSTRPLLVNASGISFRHCTRAILENNIVSDTEDNSAVYYQNCDSTKFFNNQNTAGELLRGYNQLTSRFTLELEDAVQDVLLPV